MAILLAVGGILQFVAARPINFYVVTTGTNDAAIMLRTRVSALNARPNTMNTKSKPNPLISVFS